MLIVILYDLKNNLQSYQSATDKYFDAEHSTCKMKCCENWHGLLMCPFSEVTDNMVTELWHQITLRHISLNAPHVILELTLDNTYLSAHISLRLIHANLWSKIIENASEPRILSNPAVMKNEGYVFKQMAAKSKRLGSLPTSILNVVTAMWLIPPKRTWTEATHLKDTGLSFSSFTIYLKTFFFATYWHVMLSAR